MSQKKVLHKIIQHLTVAPHIKDELELEVSAEWGDPDEDEEVE